MLDLGTPVVVTDYATAELVKVTANAFLATKISFINAVAEVCEVAGADVVALADAIGYDERIGRKFLDAGIGFGGGCLPKDLRAFLHRAGELGVEDLTSLLGEVDAINQHQRERVVQIATAMIGGGVSRGAGRGVGRGLQAGHRRRPRLAGALDRRPAAPARRPGDGLRPEGRRDRAAAYPTMRYATTPSRPAGDAELVMHMTEWPEFRDVDIDAVGAAVGRKQLLDGRNMLDPAAGAPPAGPPAASAATDLALR